MLDIDIEYLTKRSRECLILAKPGGSNRVDLFIAFILILFHLSKSQKVPNYSIISMVQSSE